MFKVLFLQRLYGMSDPQIEYHIKDRTSFRDFLDIQSVDDVPDEKTVWKYKDALAQSGTYDELFKRFNRYLDCIGLIVNEGKIIDASFVIAPRQRNTREENKKIKEGKEKDCSTTTHTRSATTLHKARAIGTCSYCRAKATSSKIRT